MIGQAVLDTLVPLFIYQHDAFSPTSRITIVRYSLSNLSCCSDRSVIFEKALLANDHKTTNSFVGITCLQGGVMSRKREALCAVFILIEIIAVLCTFLIGRIH
jgi:hypothetical protein